MSFPTKGRDFLVSKASYRLRYQATSCSRVEDTLSAGVKRPGREAVHIPSGADEVKKEWSYTSTPTYMPTWRAQGHLCRYSFLGLVRAAILIIGVSLDTAGIPTLPGAWAAAAQYS